MFKKGDIVEVYIDSLVYGGEGIGKINGMSVFVPDTAPEDKVKAEIVSIKKNYIKARLVEVTEPSRYRVKPGCNISKVCGSCQWQYISYNEQLKSKRKIVEDCFKKIANVSLPVHEVIPGECASVYRYKVQYPVQQTKVSKRFLAGYYKKGSHDVVNIKYCPVQPDIIDKITQFLRDKAQSLGLTAYNDNTKKGLIRHFVFRVSKSQNDLLLIIVINSDKIRSKLRELCNEIKAEFSELSGVLVNFNQTGTNIIMTHNFELISGKDYIEENLDGKKFKISAGSFFQVNPTSAINMFNTVYNLVKERAERPEILDVYAGVGSFAIWLKDLSSKIIAIEENPIAIKDAKDNILLNQQITGADIQVIEGNADSVLQDLVKENKSFDVTILDPPRKGCSIIALDCAIKLTRKNIIYVSCNPSTLARDVKILKENGFIPEFVQPVDMFCHTYHIESIVVLKKQD